MKVKNLNCFLILLSMLVLTFSACGRRANDINKDGGIQLVLEASYPNASAKKQNEDSLFEAVIGMLNERLAHFFESEPTIQRVGNSNKISVSIPGVTNRERINKLLQSSADLEFWETFNNDEIFPVFEKINSKLVEINGGLSDTLTDVETSKDSSLTGQLQNQKAPTPSKEELIQKNPLYAVLRPAVGSDNGDFRLMPGPVVGFAIADDTAKVNAYLNLPEIKLMLPKYSKFMWTYKPLDRDGTTFQLIALRTDRTGKPALSGNIITEARKVFDENLGGTPQITIKMNQEAGWTWKFVTQKNIGRSIAMALDGSVYSFPTVAGEISGGASTISGNFTIEEADDLANILKTGKLPMKLTVVEEVLIPSLRN